MSKKPREAIVATGGAVRTSTSGGGSRHEGPIGEKPREAIVAAGIAAGTSTSNREVCECVCGGGGEGEGEMGVVVLVVMDQWVRKTTGRARGHSGRSLDKYLRLGVST